MNDFLSLVINCKVMESGLSLITCAFLKELMIR